jgi:tRNA threonylcarbamoyladenosine biosynthesis protein TsaE
LLAQEIFCAKFTHKFALVLALSGDLGAGKTTFVQGFLRGAGIRKKITSPTFIIVKSYKVKGYKDYKKIYHIDCYRIHKPKDILNTGIGGILNNPENIVLIEWPERIKKLLPKKIIAINLKHGKKENERELNLISKSL